jgi:predicted small lipoprotein YifL
MRRILPAALRALSAGLALVLLLSACGLKGDLTLPESAPTQMRRQPEQEKEPDSDDRGRIRMKRVPEPELMDSAAQVDAYAAADFTEGNQAFADRAVDGLDARPTAP